MSAERDDVEPIAHATRLQILETAALLFHERGFSSVSIRDIGAAAKISSSTLYHHFTDKQEILFAINDRFMIDFNAAMDEVAHADGTPTERLRNVIVAHIRFQYVRRRELLSSNHFRRALNPAQRDRVLELMREYRDIVRSIVDDGIAAGEFDVLDGGLAVGLILDMVNGIREWYSDRGPLQIDTIATEYADAALRVCGQLTSNSASRKRSRGSVVRR